MAQASIIIFLLHLQLLFAQVVHERNSATSNDEDLNKDSVILSKLGDFFLNVDEAFSRVTAPKVEAEDRAKEQLYGRTQSARSNYLGRIRENYRNLQKRIGSSLGLTSDVSIMSDLFGINVQNKEGRSSVNVDLPFLPMKFSTSSKQVKDSPDSESSTAASESVSETGVPEQQKLPEFMTDLQLGNIKINVDSKSSMESPRVQVSIKPEDIQPRFSRSKLRNGNVDQSTASEYNGDGVLNRGVKGFGQIPEDTSKLASRKGIEEIVELPETEEESEVSGRILGDLLYSESTFDKIMKRIIKDSKWLLDSDLSPSKVFERLNRLTQRIPARQETSSELSKNEFDDQEFPSSTLSYILEDEETTESSSETQEMPRESIQYEVDEMPSDQDVKFTFVPHSGSELNPESLYEEDILLAFTPQGVPLKLKMPSEVEDPLQFLHDTLSAAGVTLNIPVETYENIVPVGKDILQLGSLNGGLMAQAFYVDLSKYDQMKSLLKTLRKFTPLKQEF